MSNLKTLMLVAALPAMAAFSSDLLSVDFESDTVGLVPIASDVAPVANDPFNGNEVVNSSVNIAGTGNGSRMYDFSAGGSTRLAYDLTNGVSVSAMSFEFNTASLTNSGGTGDYIAACVVQSGISTGASANRYAEVRMLANGHVRFYSAGSYISNSNLELGLGTPIKIGMFINDSDQPIVNYSGARTLAPNTVDYWVNDSYYLTGNLNSVSAGTTSGLGRAGFAVSTPDLDMNWVLDDLVCTTIVAGDPVDYIFREDYETGQTVGLQPNGAVNVRPSVNNAGAFVKIVDGVTNSAGTGNAVQMFDDATVNSSTDITTIEYHFVPDAASQISVLRADFTFAPLDTTGPGDKFFAVGIGEFNTSRTFQTTRNRYIDARLYNDGTIDFRTANTNAPSSENNALLASSNTLSIYVNDYDAQSIDYTGLNGNNYTLPANSVAYWLNGDLVLMDGGEEYTELDLDDVTGGGTIGTSEDNFGKFGFSSGTSEYNLSYVLDNIYITTNILISIDSYEEWLDLYPSLGSATNYNDDLDADLMNNLLEFALGANPTTNDAVAYWPDYEADGTGINYIYNRRDNADDIGMTYDVSSETDLVSGSFTTPTAELGSSPSEPGFEVVTNRLDYTTGPEAFIKLQVELTE